jgi:methylated-DNA-[protein]-cysteine S-methyltransferase
MSSVARIYRLLPSPIGELLLAGDGEVLSEICFEAPGKRRTIPADWACRADAYTAATAQLEEYFAGKRRDFDLALRPEGTPFQLQVWNALRQIPYGETISYKQLAERVGNPASTRAVGAANGRNPLPIVVPCHRVIGSDGSLTGFGGGLPTKKWLLELERAHCGKTLFG